MALTAFVRRAASSRAVVLWALVPWAVAMATLPWVALPARAAATASGQQQEAPAVVAPAATPEAAAATPAPTPETAAPPTPGTGDAVVDTYLADIDVYAARFPEAFVDELVRYSDAPRPLLAGLLEQGRHRPGDLYYACALARVSGRPCRGVLEARDATGASAGWESIAASLGVRPGDARATRLREGIAESYRRWGRRLPGAE